MQEQKMEIEKAKTEEEIMKEKLKIVQNPAIQILQELIENENN